MRAGEREEDRGVGQKTARSRAMLRAEDGSGAENEWRGSGNGISSQRKSIVASSQLLRRRPL